MRCDGRVTGIYYTRILPIMTSPPSPCICIYNSQAHQGMSLKALSKSAMISAIFSIPTETCRTLNQRREPKVEHECDERRTRMRSGVTPDASCSSSVSCWCVVVAGWITRVFASPAIQSGARETKYARDTRILRTDVGQVAR